MGTDMGIRKGALFIGILGGEIVSYQHWNRWYGFGPPPQKKKK